MAMHHIMKIRYWYISKKKQHLYEKFLKHKTTKTLETYKNYKNLFEKIKKSSKRLYYQNKLEKCKNSIKTTWKTMKEIIGKSKVSPEFT